MNKLMTLCYNCRQLIRESYDVEPYMTKMVPIQKCEYCGKKYDLLLCRVKSKEED